MNEIKKTMEHFDEYLSLDDAAKLHGHKGPFLVLGYKVGFHIVETTKPKDEFSLSVKAYIPFKRPYSCILDGLQCSTKCTLGKGNIECIDSDLMRIIFECKDSNKTIQISFKKEVINEALTCENPKQLVEKWESVPAKEFIETIEII